MQHDHHAVIRFYVNAERIVHLKDVTGLHSAVNSSHKERSSQRLNASYLFQPNGHRTCTLHCIIIQHSSSLEQTFQFQLLSNNQPSSPIINPLGNQVYLKWLSVSLATIQLRFSSLLLCFQITAPSIQLRLTIINSIFKSSTYHLSLGLIVVSDLFLCSCAFVYTVLNRNRMDISSCSR